MSPPERLAIHRSAAESGDVVFEPQYGAGHYAVLSCVWLAVVVTFLTCMATGVELRVAVLASVAVSSLPLILRIRHTKRIVFGDQMVVVRYLLSDKYLTYSDIMSVDRREIRTLKGDIRCGNWRNMEAFLDMMAELKDLGRITEKQFGERTVGDGH